MKKVLIFTAGFGEGHNTAAKNLRAGLAHRLGNDRSPKIYDLFVRKDSGSGLFWRDLYLKGIDTVPFTWQWLYHIVDRTHIFQNSLWFFRSCIKEFDAILHEEQPDVICSTYPHYSYFYELTTYRKEKKKPLKNVNVITDSISINSIWYRSECDFFIVPNTDSARVLHRAGVAEEKVLPLGFPVQLAFHEGAPCAAPCNPHQPFKVLYAVNCRKKKAPQTLRLLLEADPAWKLTVVAGRDEDLHKKLSPVAQKGGERVELLGWTDRMPQLLMDHHVVITKAGGAIVQEAIAARCPMIIHNVVPGQEEGNLALIQKNECGALAPTGEKIIHALQSCLADDMRGWRQWRTNVEKLSAPDSALKIADFLLNL